MSDSKSLEWRYVKFYKGHGIKHTVNGYHCGWAYSKMTVCSVCNKPVPKILHIIYNV